MNLKTNRLCLRELNDSDWKMISFLRSDVELNEFVKRPTAETKEKAMAFIKKIQSGIAEGSFYYWVITEKENNLMIGSICLWNFSEDRKKAELGYDLHPDFQGRGIMTESLVRIITFGWGQLKLDTIEAFTHGENARSTLLLERNGFELHAGITDAAKKDNVVYAIHKP